MNISRDHNQRKVSQKLIGAGIGIMLSLSGICQTETSTLTLKQAVDAALQNNVGVQQADLQAQAASVNVKQAKANLLPDLFANVSQGINQGRSIDPFTNSYINQQVGYGNYSLNSSVTLFNGFQAKNLIKQNEYNAQASAMDAQQARDNVMLNVILAYLQVLNNEEQLMQAKNQVDLTSKQVNRLQIMHDSGAIAPGLLFDLQGQLANDDLATINSQNALNAARLTLAQLMNVPYQPNLQVEKIAIDLVSPKGNFNIQSLFDVSSTQLALVKAADLRIASAKKSLQVAKGLYYPTLGLSGSFNTYYSSAAGTDVVINTTEAESGDYVTVNGSKVPVITTRTNFTTQKISFSNQFNNNYNTSVFLSLQIPILNRFRAKNRVTLARIDLRNAELSAQGTKTQLGQNIEQAYFNITAALERYKILQQQVVSFAESFRTAEVRFNAGAINQVDYIIAKNNLERARINLITAKYDYLFRSKILNYYQGTLQL